MILMTVISYILSKYQYFIRSDKFNAELERELVLDADPPLHIFVQLAIFEALLVVDLNFLQDGMVD